MGALATLGIRHAAHLAYYKAMSPVTARRTRRGVADIVATMQWVEHVVPAQPLAVSVVLCTRNRATLLDAAVASVFAQTHERWQLIIVDDGSTDDTWSYLRSLSDARVVTVKATGVGAAAARNIGLDAVLGDVVTFLDDDNRLHPGWLKTVAWAFDALDADVAYGARITEHAEAVHGSTATSFPGLHFVPYDARRQSYLNTIDLGTIAHRPRRDVRFDPDPRIRRVDDWDYIRRLTKTTTPMALPALACFYATGAPDRLTGSPLDRSSIAAAREMAVRHRARINRPTG